MSQSDQPNQKSNRHEFSDWQNQDEEAANLEMKSQPSNHNLTHQNTSKSSTDKSHGDFFNKSLAFGFVLGLLVFWGSGKFLSRSPDSEPAQNGQEVTQKSSETPGRAVTSTLVESTLVNKTIEATGTVESTDLVPVFAEVNGIPIREILVREGSQVKRGQVLAKLKDDNLKTEYLEAKAAVEQFAARLAELKAGTRSEEIRRAEQRVKSARARLNVEQSDLELAKKRVTANKNLVDQGAISRDRFDEVFNEAQSSRARVNEAQADLDEVSQELEQLRAGNIPAIISQAQAELSQAQARLQRVALQLENTDIKAVTDGIIAERNAQIGDVTSDSQNLFTIIDNGNLELRLQVPETDLSKLQVGQVVEIGKDKSSFETIKSTIKSINPVISSESRQATIKVDLPRQTQLKPGMFLNAAITIDKISGATVPIKALLPQNDGQALVFVVQPDQTVKARTVSLGNIIDNDRIEIKAGLQPNEQIILKGATYLKDGDRVSIAKRLVESVK